MRAQSPLRSEALGIVEDLQLLPVLARYGRVELVGSVALDLIVKRDIDLHLLVEDHDLWSVARDIHQEVAARAGPAQTHIHDYLGEGGLKVGVEDHVGISGVWTIDIWVTDRVETTAFAHVDHLRKTLTSRQRAQIMALKRMLVERRSYAAGTGVMIYEAVTIHGIDTLASFEAFRQTRRQGQAWPR